MKKILFFLSLFSSLLTYTNDDFLFINTNEQRYLYFEHYEEKLTILCKKMNLPRDLTHALIAILIHKAEQRQTYNNYTDEEIIIQITETRNKLAIFAHLYQTYKQSSCSETFAIWLQHYWENKGGQ